MSVSRTTWETWTDKNQAENVKPLARRAAPVPHTPPPECFVHTNESMIFHERGEWAYRPRASGYLPMTRRDPSEQDTILAVDSKLMASDTNLCSAGGCGDEAPHACGFCHTAFYCSEECQTAHWKKHFQSCFFDMSVSDGVAFLVDAAPVFEGGDKTARPTFTTSEASFYDKSWGEIANRPPVLTLIPVDVPRGRTSTVSRSPSGLSVLGVGECEVVLVVLTHAAGSGTKSLRAKRFDAGDIARPTLGGGVKANIIDVQTIAAQLTDFREITDHNGPPCSIYIMTRSNRDLAKLILLLIKNPRARIRGLWTGLRYTSLRVFPSGRALAHVDG
jgi:hypothetical protein